MTETTKVRTSHQDNSGLTLRDKLNMLVAEIAEKNEQLSREIAKPGSQRKEKA